MSTTANPSRTHDPGLAVAVTGIGLVTPFGKGAAPFAAALSTGTGAARRGGDLGKWVDNGAGEPGAGDAEILAAPITDFSARDDIDPPKLRRIPRIGQFCIVAARQALGLPPGAGGGSAAVLGRYGAERVGVVLGTGFGSVDQVMEFNTGYLQGGPEAASPALFPTTVMNTAAALVAMELSLTGINITINHRDLSAVEAVAAARDQLLRGHTDAVLCGGFEELGPWLMHGYSRFGALAHGDQPMRPYDVRRTGLVLSEGAAVLLVERLRDAQARGAEILAVIDGVGRGGDDRPRIGWVRPGEAPQVAGAARAVRTALAQAGVDPASLYVTGAGNSTALDLLETHALRAALGADAARVRISSILGQTGESMMSPALRLCSGVLALRTQTLPGTLFCEQPDPEASLPGLLLRPTAAAVDAVLVPTFAQGGGSVSLVLTAH